MKAIYLNDLAREYFPDSTSKSACTQLHRWVKLNTGLQEKLAELHYSPRQRSLTPLQHQAFIDFLGAPEGRYPEPGEHPEQ